MNAYRLKPLRYPWPPVVYVLAIAMAFFADRYVGILPPARGDGYFFIAIGGLLVAVAIALDIWAVKTLLDCHTAVLPNRCAQRLVTTGPFRFTRNPIYLGYTLLTLAFGLLTGNAWFFIAGLTAAALTTMVAIRCEEMHLLARFGADFEHYCQHTRRWI
ncbi:isoprenylcysteine carboxylmethyltransferase family protein [Rhizobium sp. S153]|uniref:Isoprenylcysteine carboxylmethyltransferase family protein n=1 Tax=Ciceribacter sichuanensis TaxID=2949647 RepID=A0ABT0VI75_9HYPH|nr:isoprenylcysteine carboxylmethyltransferase family protein [Ciceribacter sp. S153]MCM2404155.1 isoprenylcysteine carboxylmethyltransferase family protein [Ciceribacter sp. S153]